MKTLHNEYPETHNSGKEKFYSVQLVRTPRLAKILAYWCGGIFLLLVLCTFLPWTQNIRSTGKLTSLKPADRPQTIHSTIPGRIEKWLVAEGQKVKKGDTIIRLSEIKEKYFDPQLLSRINEQVQSKEGSKTSTMQKAEALKKQITALKSGLTFSLNKAKNKIIQAELKVVSDSMDFNAIQAEYEIARNQYERQEKLYQQGLKSLTELEQRRLKLQEVSAKVVSAQNKFNASKNELQNSQIEISSIMADYSDKISKTESELGSTLSYLYSIDGELAKMTNEYSNMQIRSSYYNITAPQDGYVVKALKQGIGETIKEGEPVVTIMPDNPSLAVELYVKPMDVPLLSKDRKVRLQFDGWPALVFSGWPNVTFGTFGGRIAVIDNIDSQGKYRILVVPDQEEEAWPEALRIGSGVYGWAMLNDVPIWYELWRQLNGFPPDYMESSENIFSESKNKEKEETFTE